MIAVGIFVSEESCYTGIVNEVKKKKKILANCVYFYLIIVPAI